MPQVTTYTRDKILPPERAYFDGRIALAELLQEWSKNGGLPSCAENPEPRVTSFRTIGVDVPSSNIAWEGIAIINRLFGTIDRTLKVRHGTEHYDSPNKPRLGDLVAAAGVNEIFTAMYPSAKRVNGLFQSVDFKGTIICIGDPQPNAISRTILQYKPVDYAPYSSGQLRRLQKQPLFFDLPFEPVFEKHRIPVGARYIKRLHNGKTRSTINWAIQRNTGSNRGIICSDTDENGFLTTDLLLITVLPNLLDVDSFYRGHKIIIFGGTHGIATRAVNLLLEDVDLLLHLDKCTAPHGPYWQALLKVTRIARDKQTEHPTRLSREIESSAVGINLDARDEWLAKAKNIHSWPHVVDLGILKLKPLVLDVNAIDCKSEHRTPSETTEEIRTESRSMDNKDVIASNNPAKKPSTMLSRDCWSAYSHDFMEYLQSYEIEKRQRQKARKQNATSREEQPR